MTQPTDTLQQRSASLAGRKVTPTDCRPGWHYADNAQGDEAEPEMCPNCVTPWKCNRPHEMPTPPEEMSAEDLAHHIVYHVREWGFTEENILPRLKQFAQSIKEAVWHQKTLEYNVIYKRYVELFHERAELSAELAKAQRELFKYKTSTQTLKEIDLGQH